MLYHCFPNLQELLIGDLQNKRMQNIKSIIYLHRKCNCNYTSKIYDKCSYNNGICRKCCILYKLTFQICKVEYIWDTHNYKKTCMGYYFSKVQKLLHTSRFFDTFAEHYDNHMDSNNSSARDICRIFKF